MRKIKNSKLFLMAFGTLLLINLGCSKSNPLNPIGNCFGGNWAVEYTNELEEWAAASQAYNENPNATTCSSYKSAAKSYIDAVENIYDCIPTADRAEFDNDLKEAKANIDSEDCIEG